MRHFPFASLRARLLLLIVLAVVPIIALTIYTNIELRRSAAADAKAEALRLVRLAASDQQDMIKDTRQFLFALAQLPDVRNADPVACSAFLARLFNQYPQYALLGVIASDGDLSWIGIGHSTGAGSSMDRWGPVHFAQGRCPGKRNRTTGRQRNLRYPD